MTTEEIAVEEKALHENEHHETDHKVKIKVDSHEVTVRAGTYTVAEFKAIIGVDPAKELDEIIHGKITPLDDTAKIVIKGGEEFISHVRGGASS